MHRMWRERWTRSRCRESISVLRLSHWRLDCPTRAFEAERMSSAFSESGRHNCKRRTSLFRSRTDSPKQSLQTMHCCQSTIPHRTTRCTAGHLTCYPTSTEQPAPARPVIPITQMTASTSGRCNLATRAHSNTPYDITNGPEK